VAYIRGSRQRTTGGVTEAELAFAKTFSKRAAQAHLRRLTRNDTPPSAHGAACAGCAAQTAEGGAWRSYHPATLQR